MCGRFDTSHLTWADIHRALETYSTVITAPLNLQPNDDVRPTTDQVVARLADDGWHLEAKRWGLVPHWRSGKPLKDTEKGNGDGFKLTTFNARSEKVAEAATFRDAFRKRRCVVPASAWYEWTGEAGSKVKHRFARKDRQPIWFAGLYDRAETTDAGSIESFTILTGPSGGWLAECHDRAPVILDASDLMGWMIATSDIASLATDVRPDRFELA